MGCNSDYLEPTHRERELQRAAKLLAFVLSKAGKPVPAAVSQAADHIYCKADFVPSLCELLTDMPEEERDRIVYDARDKVSRDLADWWEEHQKADIARLQCEAEAEAEAQKQKLMQTALAKLTTEEAAALGYTK